MFMLSGPVELLFVLSMIACLTCGEVIRICVFGSLFVILSVLRFVLFVVCFVTLTNCLLKSVAVCFAVVAVLLLKFIV